MSNLLNRRKTSAITEIITSQGKIAKGREAAAEIKKIFCNMGPNLALRVPATKIHFEVSTVTSEFEWGYQITPEEVVAEIKKLDVTKSSGIPKLSTKILKECLYATANNFTALLNCCVRQSVFPYKFLFLPSLVRNYLMLP